MPTSPAANQSLIYQRPVELLRTLIRFDTSNPPGSESGCIAYLNDLLTGAGCQTTILARTAERPNLIAHLKGQGQAPTLLLYGHADVVTTEHQVWQNPPFEGNLVEGYVWGRGALDMKGGLAMMVAAFLRAKAENLPLPGDVLLAIVSDEEAGGDYGAKYLVENHATLFEGVRYAIGEFGGFTFHIGERRFYPIMVAEKQICRVRATVRGSGGHGSLTRRGGAMTRLARLLERLERRPLPVHVTPVARQMIDRIRYELPLHRKFLLRLLINPLLTERMLKLLGERGQVFAPLLHNTANATIVRGGDKINVIPSEIVVELDGRLLPGHGPADLMAELRQILGDEVELELIQYDPGPAEPDMGLFDTLAAILLEADPQGIPTPMLLPAATDARFFSRLGIQTYGFLPMSLPVGFNFMETIHGPDERIPVGALDFGIDAIYRLLQRFGNRHRDLDPSP